MPELDLPQDYTDLLHELLDAGAEFVVVGGWAVAVHGHGRATDDLDLLVRPTLENAVRVYEALQRYGAPLAAHGVTADLFATERYGYRIGVKPILIEILTTVSGIDFDEANRDRIVVNIAGRAVPFIGRSALLANKRAAGRAKDLADIEALETVDSDTE
jgi:predicted nucleotidyltransferase